MKKRILALALGTMSVFAGMSTACGSGEKGIILTNVERAKNVILMIGDGMGPEHIKAGKIKKGESLYMQRFPYKTTVETRSISSEITDSAAGGTALATGVRTYNGRVGMDTYDEELTTIMDVAKSMGKRTGVISTEPITGATPMSFLSHALSRDDKATLVEGAAKSGVNLIASETFDASYIAQFVENGYTQLTDADMISDSTAEFIIGSYKIKADAEYGENSINKLAFDRLLVEALDYLSEDEDGFVLMAEGAHIDHGGHNNNISYMLEELLAFDNGIHAVLEWAKNRDDTVVIVTADHETGGLWLDKSATADTLFPGVRYQDNYYGWTTDYHTSTDVNLYINGADIDFAKYSFGSKKRIRNYEVFEIMKYLIGAE